MSSRLVPQRDAIEFDFTNGFHDTANAMATSIATGALRPKVAVGISAVLNLVGAFLSVEVAKTISSGLVNESLITPTVIFAGLVGAIVWNLLTWLLGLPSSSSHASLAHGTNDAQKTMGVITLTLITAGALPVGSSPPVWVILTAGLSIALGTYLGGWRIIRTLGKRITEIETPQGFAAETTSTAVILVSSKLGFPLSTTQVCSGAIFGAGAGKRLAAVRWSLAGQMALAWLFTMPAAAIVGALAAQIAETGVAGTVLVALGGVVIAAGIYALSRRRPVNAANVNQPVTPAQLAPSTV